MKTDVDRNSAEPPCYLTFAESPWMQISMDRIARIDYPPIEMQWDREPFHVFVERAICVVTVDCGELWSRGDRSWRERERQKRADSALYNLVQAERKYRESLVR